jgi:hypothetical protein
MKFDSYVNILSFALCQPCLYNIYNHLDIYKKHRMKRALVILCSLLLAVIIALGGYVALSADQAGLRHALLHGTADAQPPAAALKTAFDFEKLRLGANMGRKKAQFKLGRLFASGRLGFTDMTRAAHWMQVAAGQGYGPAQLYMARFAFLGEGEPKDLSAGAQWVQKAAENNVPDAAGFMGILYLGGIGVAQDFDHALSWKKSGTPEADAAAANLQKSLDAVKALPPEQQADAMKNLAGRMKLDISHSFVKTLDELRKTGDNGADGDTTD